VVFRLEEGVGIGSLASGRSSRACAHCFCVVLLSGFRSCCPAEVRGMQRHCCAHTFAMVLTILLAYSAAAMAPRHPNIPELLPSSPLLR